MSVLICLGEFRENFPQHSREAGRFYRTHDAKLFFWVFCSFVCFNITKSKRELTAIKIYIYEPRLFFKEQREKHCIVLFLNAFEDGVRHSLILFQNPS